MKKLSKLHPTVLIISSPPEMGGGEIYVKRLIKELGHDYNFIVMTQLFAFKRVARSNGAEVWNFYLPIKFYNNHLLRLFILIQPFYWFQFFIVMLLRRPHLIHVQSNEERLSVAFPARMFGIPVVWTAHGPLDVSGSRAYSKYFKYAALKVSRIICIAEFVMKSIVAAGAPEEKCRLIYHGVDAAYFTPSKKPGEVITYIGRLEKVKNPSLFIDIAEEIQSKRPSAKFRMVGSGSLLENIKTMALERNLAIDFTGQQNDIMQYLDNASILVITSETEGLGLSAIEAMASGVPVMATAVGGLKEVIADGKTGFLIDSDDPKIFADAALKLLDNEQLHHTMAIASRELALQKFSLTRSIQYTNEVYEQAIYNYEA